MIVLVKLILAHLLGDYFFQSAALARQKATYRLHSSWLYIHALQHGALVMLLIWDIAFWLPALILVVTHFCIDAAKTYLQNDRNKRAVFFIDQFLHLAVIGLIWYYWVHPDISMEWIFSERNTLYMTAVVALTIPTSVLIRVLISTWAPYTEDAEGDSLRNAGRYIGILERIFVFVFVVTGRWEGIGFLLAAKSIFRFGDLKESKDRKLTEYILIGTLLSFGVATGMGMAVAAFEELWFLSEL